MKIEIRDGIARLCMNEGKANAMNAAFVAALDAALDEVERGNPTAVVLTGEGRHFCAGLDLATMNSTDSGAMARFLEDFERVMTRVFLLPRPVVAAVNGNAIAGGCILAGAADHRVGASGDYKVGVNEARIAVSFPSIALEVLRCQLDAAAFRKAVLEGDLFGPDDARTIGLLDEIVAPDRLLDVAHERALHLVRTPRAAFAQVKKELRAPYAERVATYGKESRAAFQELWFSNNAVQLRTELLAKKA